MEFKKFYSEKILIKSLSIFLYFLLKLLLDYILIDLKFYPIKRFANVKLLLIIILKYYLNKTSFRRSD